MKTRTYIFEDIGYYYRVATKVTDYKNKRLVVTTIVTSGGSPTVHTVFYGTREERDERFKSVMNALNCDVMDE